MDDPAGSPEARLDDPEVEAALTSLPCGLGPLARVERLRAALGPERGRRAAELAELRERARLRFPSGTLRHLTRKGLEQATPERAADARAREFVARTARGTVLDATCGLGSDVLALARAGADVVAADRDPVLASCARANLVAAGLPGHVVVADATRPAVRAEWLVLDPDRRVGGRRSMSPEAWSPALSRCLALAADARGAAVKLPPAFEPDRHASLFAAAPLHAFEWVSLDGALVECVLWTGILAADRAAAAARLLTARGGDERVGGPREPLDALAPDAARAARWIADPDPALLRAGQLERVARAAGARPLAASIAYLGAPRPASAPGLAWWRVRGCAPLDAKRVTRLLAEHGVGPLTVKKRGHPDPAQTLATRFGRKRGRPGVLIVARLDDGHVGYLVDPAPREMVGDEGFEPPTSSL